MHNSSTTTERIRVTLTENGVRDVPENELLELASRFLAELEISVGNELVRGLTEEQLAELDACTDSDDEEDISEFLNRCTPDFKAIVEQVTTRALDELAAAARVYFGGGAR